MAVDACDPHAAIPTSYLGKWLQPKAEDLLRVGWPRSQCFGSRVQESEDCTLLQTYREVLILPVDWQLPLRLLCGLHFLSTLLTQDPGSLASCQDQCEDRQQGCRISKAALALRERLQEVRKPEAKADPRRCLCTAHMHNRPGEMGRADVRKGWKARQHGCTQRTRCGETSRTQKDNHAVISLAYGT